MNKKTITILITVILTTSIVGSFWFFQKNIDDVIPVEAGVFQGNGMKIIKDDSKKTIVVSDIETAFYRKFSNWEKNIANVKIEAVRENSALGRMWYNGSEYVWFASRMINKNWKIIEYGVSYNGICKNFEKYNFPQDMIPDCWDDSKKELINTVNPALFYAYDFTLKDKNNILESFRNYINNVSVKDDKYIYINKSLFLEIDKNTKKYFKGRVLVGGVENYSAPYILAVKIDGNWRVIFQGQDYPPCNIVDEYNFPKEWYKKCFYVDDSGKTDLIQK